MKQWIDLTDNDEDLFIEDTHEDNDPMNEGTRKFQTRPEDGPGRDEQTKLRRMK